MPGKATITKVKAGNAGRLYARVNSVAGADGYQFQISSSKAFKSSVKTRVQADSVVGFTGLASNKRYYVRARAYSLDGTAKKFGAWSSVTTGKTNKIKIGIVGISPSTTREAGGWLRRNGCNVVKITTTKIDPKKYDGLVVPGGGDVDPALYHQKKNPHDYGINRKLDLLQINVIKKFANAGKPVIGICRGCQVINVAFGGTLYQHIKGWHIGRRVAKIKKGSMFYDLFGRYESVAHSHHQCALKLGKGLIATQWDVKDKHIEAIEHKTLPVYGLQWHPEGMGKRGSMVAKRFMSICIKTNK